MNIFDFVKDENSKPSMTRLVLLTILIIFSIASIVDIFYHVEINNSIYDIMQTIFAFGLGGQAVRTTFRNMQKGEERTIDVSTK